MYDAVIFLARHLVSTNAGC